jgi:hypothetical protein
MPYIEGSRQDCFNEEIRDLVLSIDSMGNVKGDVNYVITKIVHEWVLMKSFRDKSKLNYATKSQGYDVLAEATAEYYRTVMGLHEDEAIKKNGPISQLDSCLEVRKRLEDNNEKPS